MKVEQCVVSILRDNPSLDESAAYGICNSLYKQGKLTREFSQNTKIFSVGYYCSETFPTIGLVANRVLKYRDTPEGAHYIYIPSEVLEEAAKSMEGKPINWEHGNEESQLGTFHNPRYENNKLYGELKVTDPKYINWIKSLQTKGKIPNVSVEFSNKSGDDIKIDNGFIEICYDLEFLAIALCEQGICSDRDGCGIREFSEEKKEGNMSETPDTFWLSIVDKTIQEMTAEGFNPLLSFAVWTTQYVNNLPDSSFAVIMPGGEKDDEGKTTPRTLRKLPYKDASGKVDLPHLRNALARVSQIDAPQSVIDKARALLQKVAKEEELPSYEEKESSKKGKEEERKMSEEKTPCKEEENKELSALKAEVESLKELKTLSEQMEGLTKFKDEATEALKKMSDFLTKFEPPKEENKKELSQEELIKNAVDATVQKVLSATTDMAAKAVLIKELSEKGVTGVDGLTVDQLKALSIKVPSVEIPKNPRQTLFVDDKTGEVKTLKDWGETDKDVFSAQEIRSMSGKLPPLSAVEVEKYLAAQNSVPADWYRPSLARSNRSKEVS